METRFQTSFIPKKSVTPIGGASVPTHKHHVASLFVTISFVIFMISLVGAGGVYAWESMLLSSRETYKDRLVEKEKQFNPALIEELKLQKTKIDLAKERLNKHLATSQIFNIIGLFTIESVRFLNLDMSIGQNQTDGVNISMRGYGSSLSAIAYQSTVLGELEKYGLRKVVKNPILSDPSLDPNGTVSFGFTATIDPTSLSYEKSITPTSP